MSQITLDLPDELARALEARPDKNEVAMVLLLPLLKVKQPEQFRLLAEERAALYEDLSAAFAEGKAELGTPGHIVFARLREKCRELRNRNPIPAPQDRDI